MRDLARRLLITGAVIATGLARAEPCGAQVRGTIFGPGSRSYPVAVSPPKAVTAGPRAAEASRTFASVLERDLTISGLFRILDPASFIEQPDTSGETEDTINFGSWSVIGALALVKGTCSAEGDRVAIEARLFDVQQRRQLVGRRYTGGPADVRRMAHRFADEILAQFTGERGPFDSQIAFVSTRAGRFKELFVAGPDGGDIRQLTRTRSINVSPSWTTTNRTLLFTSYLQGNPDLFRVDVASGAISRLSSRRGLDLGGRMSPDGSRIAVTIEDDGNPEIALLDRAGRLVQRVTSHWAIDVSPTWSPDGRRLAFCSNRAGSPQIYVVDADGGEPRRITFSGTHNTAPAWSPRGDRIAYVNRSGSGFDIFTVTPEGTDVRQLTQGTGSNEDPSWSPDGRYLVFSSTRGGSRKLYVMDALGTTQVQLTHGGGDDSSPAWSGWLE